MYQQHCPIVFGDMTLHIFLTKNNESTVEWSYLTREMVDPAIYTNNDNEDCSRQMAFTKIVPALKTRTPSSTLK